MLPLGSQDRCQLLRLDSFFSRLSSLSLVHSLSLPFSKPVCLSGFRLSPHHSFIFPYLVYGSFSLSFLSVFPTFPVLSLSLLIPPIPSTTKTTNIRHLHVITPRLGHSSQCYPSPGTLLMKRSATASRSQITLCKYPSRVPLKEKKGGKRKEKGKCYLYVITL